MTRPLRVAHLIDTLSWGGAQKLLITFAETARQRQVETTVISLRPRNDSPFQGLLEEMGVPVVVLPCRRLFEPRQLWRLVALLRRERFDVLHTHLIQANVIGVIAGALSGTPVVASIHNTTAGRRRLQGLRLGLEALALERGARRVIAVGHVVADAQRERLRRTQMVTVPNAVSPVSPLPPAERAALRAELLGAADRPLLISVGRLTAQKGYADMLAAMEVLRDRRPDALLLIVGRGDLQDELAAQVAARGLADTVRLLGARDDVPRLLAASDLYLSSSLWEGLPVAVLEAMSAGLPVVATDVGELRHVLPAGCGALVPPGRPALLAEAVAALLDSPAEMAAAGRAAHAHVMRQYGPDAWVDRLLALYAEARSAPSATTGVIMLVNQFPPQPAGGAERQAERLARYMASQGVDVGVLTRAAPGLPRREVRDGFRVVRIPAPGPGKLAAISFTLGAMWTLLRERGRYQVLHAHLAFAPAVAAALVGRLLGKRVIVKFGNSGAFGDIQVSQSSRLGRIKLALLRRWVDLAVALDAVMAAELRGAGFAPGRIALMANGIDADAFARRSDRADAKVGLGVAGKTVLLFVGRLAPQKALPDLLAALADLAGSRPDLHLFLLGQGDERALLEREAAQLGVGGKLTFAGNVADVQPYLDAADLFVLPSLAEGVSNALLEAMAAGLPCLATSVGGTPEVLDYGTAGVLVPPGQPAALANAINDLLGRPEELARLATAARARIEQHYAIGTVGGRYLDLYEQLSLRDSRAMPELT